VPYNAFLFQFFENEVTKHTSVPYPCGPDDINESVSGDGRSSARPHIKNRQCLKSSLLTSQRLKPPRARLARIVYILPQSGDSVGHAVSAHIMKSGAEPTDTFQNALMP
jgi:hypothetical protein